MDVADETCSVINSQQTTADAFVENIKIYLRVRPFIEREDSGGVGGDVRRPSILQLNADGLPLVSLVNRGVPMETFEYDHVGGPETSQLEVFEAVAKQITDNCLQGYNGTIFAYGQTGSGKTFTMQGPQFLDGDSMAHSEDRGLILRTFEYLFDRIEEASQQGISFECKCSYIEIYNEAIYDLLDPYGKVCGLREDTKKGGVFVEDCTMALIRSPFDAYQIFAEGARNRHVASTSMNRESSRSHSVFTLFISSKSLVGEIVDHRESRFNLVDLAGSERQQLTGTVGLRLKEAGNINKSLLALSNVINALVETSGGRPRHVHYRDSKLTFLLRDSLGGNAKTCIVANVSPSPFCQAETLSTLRFAQRAKMIKNQAVVNKDIQGNTAQLQAEIRRLQQELALAKNSNMAIDTDEDFIDKRMSSINMRQPVNSNELRIARQRQIDLSNEVLKLREALEMSEELVKRKEHQAQTTKMLLRLRENAINSLKEEKPMELFVSEEVERLEAELDLLRSQPRFEPETIRLAIEYAKLKERFEAVDGLTVEDFDRLSYQLQHQQQLIDTLTKKLVSPENGTEEEPLKKQCRLSLDARIPELEAELKSLNNELTVLNSDLALERDNCRKLVEDLTTIEGTKADLLAKIDEMTLEHTNLVLSHRDLERKFEESEQMRKTLNQLVETRDAELDELNKSFTADQIKLKNLEKEFHDAKEMYQQKLESLEEAKKSAIENLQISHNQQVDQIKRLHQSAVEGLRTTLKNEMDQSQAAHKCEAEQLKANLLRAESFLSEAQLNLGTFTSECEALRSRNRELNRQIEQEKATAQTQLQLVSANSQSAQEEKIIVQMEMANMRASLMAAEKSLKESNEETQSLKSQLALLQAEKEDLASRPQIDEVFHRKILADNQLYLQKISKLEYLLRNADENCNQLMADLEQRPDPDQLSALQASLDAAVKERDHLKSLTSQLEEENIDLAEHTNKNQRIMILSKIKEENNGLKESVLKAQKDLVKERELSAKLIASIEKAAKMLMDKPTEPDSVIAQLQMVTNSIDLT